MGEFSNIRTLAFEDEDNRFDRSTPEPGVLEVIGQRVANFFGGGGKKQDLMDEILATDAMRSLATHVDDERVGHDINSAQLALQHFIDMKRVVLCQELTRPSWGPKISSQSFKRKQDRNFKRGKKGAGKGLFSRIGNFFNRDEAGHSAQANAAALEPGTIMHRQDQEISFNLEQSRRYSQFKWLYFVAAFASIAIVSSALLVDYSILKEFWHQAMMNEYMIVPADLQNSVSLKALQVLFATIGIHLVLRHVPNFVVTAFTAVIFVMTVLMMISIGFLYAHKTLPVDNQATVSGETTEESGLLGALAESGIIGGADNGEEGEPGGPIGQGLSQFFDADTLAWIDAVGWLVALTAVFLVVASIGALFLLWAEHNIRNFILASDYANRKDETARLRYAESVALQVN